MILHVREVTQGPDRGGRGRGVDVEEALIHGGQGPVGAVLGGHVRHGREGVSPLRF